MERFTEVVDALRSSDPIAGFTHDFYRYPARFSPTFVRAAIEEFTEPGDCVLDPFMGGGTTVVESLALGRKVVGVDINPIAAFVARVKSTPLSPGDAKSILEWFDSAATEVNLHNRSAVAASWRRYQKDVPWWIRKTLEALLNRVDQLDNRTREEFVRCVLLRTAQWALDCRKDVPSKSLFLRELRATGERMVAGSLAYRDAIRQSGSNRPSQVTQGRRLLTACASEIPDDKRIPDDWLPPRLVLTSPPYPGVHVLYHRWQVRGRRETSAPFWIAGCLDGHGAAHYTFGARNSRTMDRYEAELQKTFCSIASLMDERSHLVQLVAFGNGASHLKMYLNVMRNAGLEETQLGSRCRRVWRDVPNRKWYADYQARRPASREVLLVHRKA